MDCSDILAELRTDMILPKASRLEYVLLGNLHHAVHVSGIFSQRSDREHSDIILLHRTMQLSWYVEYGTLKRFF